MRLKNKKTGEIVDARGIAMFTNVYLKIFCDGNHDTKEYSSLAELCKEWEDAELEIYWYINALGMVFNTEGMDRECLDDMRAIGNLFKTKEEAEKGVERLKGIAALCADESFFAKSEDGELYGGEE